MRQSFGSPNKKITKGYYKLLKKNWLKNAFAGHNSQSLFLSIRVQLQTFFSQCNSYTFEHTSIWHQVFPRESFHLRSRDLNTRVTRKEHNAKRATISFASTIVVLIIADKWRCYSLATFPFVAITAQLVVAASLILSSNTFHVRVAARRCVNARARA